jgi:two-component system sensor histidine kinase TtrS
MLLCNISLRMGAMHGHLHATPDQLPRHGFDAGHVTGSKQESGWRMEGLIRIALIVTLIFALPAMAQDANSTDPQVRIVGVLAHRGDDAARTRWQPTLDAVSLGIPELRFELVPLSLDGVRSALSRSEIDYLFTNPGHLIRLEEQFRLYPMVALRSDLNGSPETGNRYGAVIFTRGDNDEIATLADLKNRKFAAVAPDAFGGFEVAAAALIRNGVDPWRDLSAIAFSGFPQDAIIEAVMSGAVDAGTVRTGILEAAVASGKLEAHEVRILNALRVPGFDYALSTDLVPEWTFSATANVSEPERRLATIALLGMPEWHPALLQGRYGGWTTVPSDVAVRRLLALVDDARSAASRGRSGLLPLVWSVVAMALLIVGGVLAFRMRRNLQRTAGFTTEKAADGMPVHLTPREIEILSLVSGGKTTKEIARDLGISPKTVEFHRSHLMRKFDASNMAELVSKAGAVVPR